MDYCSQSSHEVERSSYFSSNTASQTRPSVRLIWFALVCNEGESNQFPTWQSSLWQVPARIELSGILFCIKVVAYFYLNSMKCSCWWRVFCECSRQGVRQRSISCGQVSHQITATKHDLKYQCLWNRCTCLDRCQITTPLNFMLMLKIRKQSRYLVTCAGKKQAASYLVPALLVEMRLSQ